MVRSRNKNLLTKKSPVFNTMTHHSSAILLLISTFCLCAMSKFESSDISLIEKTKEGQVQYNVIIEKARRPKYGTCWKNTLSNLESGCKHLTDEVQMRLAIQFTNCFLHQNGRPTYECNPEMTLPDCTKLMTDVDFGTYLSFFTHTQNMCFFLQSQVWQDQTENTISKLSVTSENVAQQLEQSTHTQTELLDKQKQSIERQDVLLERGQEMRNTIESSTTNVKMLFDDFKVSTQQQRALIGEVFDRVSKLQSLVLGEFTGLYSVIFYALSLIISYVVTCTGRTASARFWIFLVMTINVVVERIIVVYSAEGNVDEAVLLDSSTVIYYRLWLCRKVCCFIAIIILVVAVLVYKDYNVINNQLLMDIKKQNSELKYFLSTGQNPLALQSDAIPSMLRQSGSLNNTCDQVDNAYGSICMNDLSQTFNTSGYDSDSESDSTISVDNTYIPEEDADDTSNCSFRTTDSRMSSRESTPALLDEIRDLRAATPFRQMTPVKESTPVKNITPLRSNSFIHGDNILPQSTSRQYYTRSTQPLNVNDEQLGAARYFLRKRTKTSHNPLTNIESPGQFSKVVKRLAKVAARNSFKTRFTIQKKDMADVFSSDDN